MTRLLSLLFSVLLLVGSVYADENIVDYSDTSLPVLNEELRKLRDGVRNTHSIPSGGTTGQVLVKDTATNYDTSWTTPYTAGSQEYTTGSGNWTCPTGVTKVFITAIGGGGTGGTGDDAATGAGGGGGSSGGHIFNIPYTTVPGNTYAYAVGAAGADTTFGTLTASKGANGYDATPTLGGLGSIFAGILKATAGGIGISNGGAPGRTDAEAGADAAWGGNGGASMFGAGGKGGIYQNAGGSPSAGAYGAGGGGGGCDNGSYKAGGAGLGGYILIQW